MKIDLSTTILPEEGEYVGTFVDIAQGSITGKKNNEVLVLKLVAELPKPKDKDFRLTAFREYRLDTKGIKALKADVESWRGRSLTMDEMAQFDAAEEFFGKSVKLQVMRSTENGRPVAKFAHNFKPVGQEQTSSSKETAK